MNIKWIASAFVISGLAFACGGGSGDGGDIGVDGDKTLGELNATEARNVCEYLADSAGPARTVMCMDGTTVMVEATSEADIAECATDLEAVDAACTVTVDQAQACFDALADLSDEEAFCSDDPTLPAECGPLFSSEVCN
jgi:hypothetical protein